MAGTSPSSRRSTTNRQATQERCLAPFLHADGGERSGTAARGRRGGGRAAAVRRAGAGRGGGAAGDPRAQRGAGGGATSTPSRTSCGRGAGAGRCTCWRARTSRGCCRWWPSGRTARWRRAGGRSSSTTASTPAPARRSRSGWPTGRPPARSCARRSPRPASTRAASASPTSSAARPSRACSTTRSTAPSPRSGPSATRRPATRRSPSSSAATPRATARPPPDDVAAFAGVPQGRCARGVGRTTERPPATTGRRGSGPVAGGVRSVPARLPGLRARGGRGARAQGLARRGLDPPRRARGRGRGRDVAARRPAAGGRRVRAIPGEGLEAEAQDVARFLGRELAVSVAGSSGSG